MSSSFRRTTSTSSSRRRTARPTGIEEDSIASTTRSVSKLGSPSFTDRFPITDSTNNKLDGTTTINQQNVTTTPHSKLVKGRGTKPWTGGLTLTSSGVRELDTILGGGQPLGTCILLEEDRWTLDLGMVLVRYWAAEAVAQNQELILCATKADAVSDLPRSIPRSAAVPVCHGTGYSKWDLERFLSNLPRDLHFDKQEKSNQKRRNTRTEAVAPVVIEEEEDEDGDDANGNEEGLTIAWQYRTSIQRERMGTITAARQKQQQQNEQVYCHSFDLSGAMEDQHPKLISQFTNVHILDCCPTVPADVTPAVEGFRLFQRLLGHVKNIHRPDDKDPSPTRLLLLNPPVGPMSVALPLLLAFIRDRSLPIVMLITTRPWTDPSAPSLIHLRRAADTVFSLQSFKAYTNPAPPEFTNLGISGLFHIHKLNFYGENRRPFLPANRYGVKRDGRKLRLCMLHLPPEDFGRGGGSGGVRSGAGRDDGKKTGCGSGGGALDF